MDQFPRGTRLDFIGDLHGQSERLEGLLRRLGYVEAEGVYRHEEGRRVVFLGDYVDRGPGIERVLEIVRSMVEAGAARAILGNHEFNLICYRTRHRGTGAWLRDHGEGHRLQCARTLASFAGREAELDAWVRWLRTLPWSLEREGARAVHACWDEAALRKLRGRSLTDDDFLERASDRSTEEGRALNRVLSGPKVTLPASCIFAPEPGVRMRLVGVKWWLAEPGEGTYEAVAMKQDASFGGEQIEAGALRGLFPGYGSKEPPCFFGHYWLPAEATPEPVAANLACLDYSVAAGGPLVAYRWDGEAGLRGDKMVLEGAGTPMDEKAEAPLGGSR